MKRAKSVTSFGRPLFQVNVGKDEAKAGVEIEEVKDFVETVKVTLRFTSMD
jgi:uncharacterized pyridoxal phosphate-containing UPF0001 family protein